MSNEELIIKNECHSELVSGMKNDAISLLELSCSIKDTLRGSFDNPIWIRAEIAELRENKNGHCYLDLIEKQANTDQIAARVKSIIWAFSYRMLKPYFETSTGRSLSNGLKVLVQVSVEYHEVYGLSLNINDIDPTYTLGDLEQRKREIIMQLQNEGVIEMNKELLFPIVPQRIAIISSETAAGYGDFVNQLENNHYGIKFEHQLFSAIMQGDQAPASIISAFDKIYENIEQFDIVVIIRGGGASIDLLCFDDYSVAYYITQFPLPVITGIGHERDTTIADMVANTSLKTPTATAEFIITKASGFLNQIENYSENLKYLVQEKLDKETHNIEMFSLQLSQNVKDFLHRKELEINSISNKSTNKIKQTLLTCENNLKVKSRQLVYFTNSYIKNRKKHLEFLEKQNNLNNPLEILKKGYTLTFFDGKIVKQASQLKRGNLIKTKFNDGVVTSTVEI